MPLTLSATQIETFDPLTTWGCNRKWYFTYVRKLRGPPDKSLALGDAVHQTIEAYLKTGNQGVLHDVAIPGVHTLIGYRPRVKLIEQKFESAIAGVKVVGKIDAVVPDPAAFEVVDWKTTSSIGRYAKTVGQLRESTQMNIYGDYLLGHFSELELDGMTYTLGYFGTKKREHECVSARVTKQDIEQRILTIGETVSRMVRVAAETDIERVEPNEAVCNIGFGCPHRAYCPRSGSFNMASLLDAFKLVPGVAEQPAPEKQPDPAPAPVSTAPAEGVLPPDAAPREQKVRKLEIKDVVEAPPAVPSASVQESATVAPVGPPPEVLAEPERKGPGRPKGSKNKPKVFAPPPAAAPEAPAPAAVPEPVSKPEQTIQIERITLRHGAKIGMPDFSSVTVEAEYTALVHGNVETAREQLSMFVKAAMMKELETYVKKSQEKLEALKSKQQP